MITSRDNSSLKFARRVRDGKENRLIFVEEVRLAEKALRSGVCIRDAFFSEQSLEDKRIGILFSQFEDAKIVSPKAFDSLVPFTSRLFAPDAPETAGPSSTEGSGAPSSQAIPMAK